MSESSPHADAAATFADRARETYGESLRHLVVFGSTSRDEAQGRTSDVDVFLVIEDADDEADLRELAYDVGLEFGVVLSVHVLTADRFEERSDHPFVRTVFDEGTSYA